MNGMRRLKGITVAGLAVLATVALPSIAVASASGCTLAPGGILASNCQKIVGTSIHIETWTNYYSAGITETNNICNTTSKFRWTKYGATTQSYAYGSFSACYLPYFVKGWTLSFSYTEPFKNKTTACSAVKNSSTGGVYSNYACHTIGG